MNTKILSFAFNVNGLEIAIINDNGITTKKFDACATCNLLKRFGSIEDFTTDKNGEPVILFSDNSEPKGYGYQLWCDFVKSFYFTHRTAEILIEFEEMQMASRKFQARIKALLAPLYSTQTNTDRAAKVSHLISTGHRA